jgi:hypothetical protein
MPSSSLLQLGLTVAYVLLLAFFFAKVEIHIEGPNGWAANLPTWRIEQHWLLDLFWGGRAMTGYHAWVFPFIALLFHFPFTGAMPWSWHAEARTIASIILFWVAEDFLWFILNPSFGWRRFHRDHVGWHKWASGAPLDYWFFSLVAALLFGYSYAG